MVNSAIFGSVQTHASFREKLEKLEISLDETCSGGCLHHWSETEEGRQRYAALQKINDERKAAGLKHV